MLDLRQFNTFNVYSMFYEVETVRVSRKPAIVHVAYDRLE